MIRRTKVFYAILAATVASGVYSSVALAAPTEIYGYKKLSAAEYNTSSFDKYGNRRVTPDETTFSTGEKTEEIDMNTSASKRVKKHTSPILNGKVDAVSHATSGSKDSDSGSDSELDAVGSATGGFLNADLVFDFDMLANAQILKDLGYEIKEVDEVLDTFNTTTRTHIGKNSEVDFLVDYEDFISKASYAINNGEYLSFEDYLASKDYKKVFAPYRVKYVLEDGTIGEEILPTEVTKKPCAKIKPDLNNNIKGNNVTLTFDKNDVWANDITSIRLVERNGLEKDITSSCIVKSENGQIVVDSNILELGMNTIVVRTNEYRTSIVTQPIYEGKVNLKTDFSNELGKDIVIKGATEEYIKALNSIVVNGKNLKKASWSVDKETNNIVINSDEFKDEAQYSIILNSEPNFRNTKLSVIVKRELDSEVKLYEDIIDNYVDSDLEIAVSNYSEEWKNNIDRIIVGKYKYSPKDIEINDGRIVLTPEIHKNQVGNISVKVVSKDNINYEIRQHIYEKEELKVPKLSAERVELGQDMAITFEKDNKFQGSIEKIEIMSAIPTLNHKVEYTINDGRILVKYDSNKFTRNGEYILRVFAKGYEPKDVKVELVGECPKVMLPNHPKTNSIFSIQPIQDTKEWAWGENVTAIYVDGEKLDSESYVASINGIDFKENTIKIAGNHRFKVCSTGYKDYITNIQFTDENGEVLEKLEADVNFNNELTIGNNFEINSDDNKFIKAIYEVKLNGELVNENLYVKGEKLIINKDAFTKKGENEIIVKASNYKTVTLKLNVLENSNLKQAPVIESDVTNNSLSQKIELTFTDSKEWRDNLNKVLVDGEELNKDEYTVLEGKIVIKQGVLKNGNQNITIVSNGYNNIVVNQKIGKNVPDHITVIGSQKTVGDNVTINYADTSNYKVEEVYVNKSKINMDKYTEKNFAGDLTINKSVFNKAGKYTITIKSKGFVDKDFEINFKEKNKEEEKPLQAAPKDIKFRNSKIKVSENAEITYGINVLYSPSEILVNGKSINMKNDFNGSTGAGTIKNQFKEVGTYTVIVKAKGYEDKTLTLEVVNSIDNKSGETNPDKTPEKPVNPGTNVYEKLKDTPNGVAFSQNEITVGNNVEINFVNLNYARSIKEISINGNKINMEQNLKNTLGRYSLEGVFNEVGEKEALFKAEGYKDLKLTINVIEANKVVELKEVPSGVNFEKEEIKLGEDACLNITRGLEYKAEEVLIDGVKLNKENTRINLLGGFFIKKEVFKEAKEYEITLKAEGYKDKVLKLTVVGESKAPIVTPSVPEENPTISGANTEENLKDVPKELKFEKKAIKLGDDAEIIFKDREYFKSIEEILINDKIIDKDKHLENSFMKDYISKDVLNEIKDYKIIIKANGYKDATLELKVVDEKDYEKYNIKEVPEDIKLEKNKIKLGEDVILNVPFNIPDYKADKIFVDGKEIEEGIIRGMFGKTTIKGEVFNEAKIYGIVVKAKGYEDLQLQLEVNN